MAVTRAGGRRGLGRCGHVRHPAGGRAGRRRVSAPPECPEGDAVASHLHFGEDDFLNCRFAVSPLWETQDAVRTLRRPDRHGYHVPWLRRIRTAAAGLDLAPLWLLMPRRATSRTGSGRRRSVRRPPSRRRSRRYGRPIRRRPARTPPARWPAHRARSTSEQGRAWLADPVRMVRELADALEVAWRVLVEPEWPRLRALLEADVAFHSRRLAEVGLGTLLPELDARLSWDGRTLTLPGGVYERRLGGRGLVLMPSVFCWPDVITGFDPPWQPTLVYPARGVGGLWAEPGTRTPEALVRPAGPRPRGRTGGPGRPGIHHGPGPPPGPRPVLGVVPPVGPARERPADVPPVRAPSAVRADAVGNGPGLRRLTEAVQQPGRPVRASGVRTQRRAAGAPGARTPRPRRDRGERSSRRAARSRGGARPSRPWR